MYVAIISQLSSIMDLRNCSSIYKYLSVSTKLGQNVCDFTILKEFNYDLIGTELSELSALYLKNCYIWLCLHSIICKYRPVSTNTCTGTTGVICSWIGKNCCIRLLFYSLASTNINQSAPNLVTINMCIRSQMSLIMGQLIPDQYYIGTYVSPSSCHWFQLSLVTMMKHAWKPFDISRTMHITSSACSNKFHWCI